MLPGGFILFVNCIIGFYFCKSKTGPLVYNLFLIGALMRLKKLSHNFPPVLNHIAFNLQ